MKKMIEEFFDKGFKKTELKLINSSFGIDLFFIFTMLYFEIVLFNLVFVSLFIVLCFMTLYHFSWRKLVIGRNGIEVRSSLPFLSPIVIPYSEFETIKCTSYTFTIRFANIKKKLKLGLIFPWAEFLTITVSPDDIEEAVKTINHNKSKGLKDVHNRT